jgi:TRAP transporter 4TM/12TM fusion protein
MIIIVIISMIYPFIGPYLPSFLAHRGMTLSRYLGFIFLGMDGIFSSAIASSANFIFTFVLFGSFLLKSGAGDFFIDLSKSIAGKSVGGPAKVSIISSSLMGTISGSPTANVVTTGTITIPLMKDIGYKPHFAAAVVSVASTGGAITPPVMHAAAFLIVEMTGIPYSSLIKAAIIPAILFYIGLFLMVHFRAIKNDLRSLSDEQLLDTKKVFKEGWYNFLPLVLLIVLLTMGYTAVRVGLVAILSVMLLWIFNKNDRMTFKDLINTLESGARSAVLIMVACGAAGIVVATINSTGLGGKFTSIMMTLAGGNLFLSLLLTAIACIILGMGLPTPVAYILTAVLAAPALTKMDVSQISAHMFILYYAALSTITPPVAIASFTAAGIADCNPMITGLTSVRLGIVAFIMPFIFIYQPAIMLIGEPLQIIITTIYSLLGVFALCMGFEGWFFIRLNPVVRVLLIIAGLLLIIPEQITSIAGMIILFGMVIILWIKAGKPNINTIKKLLSGQMKYVPNMK